MIYSEYVNKLFNNILMFDFDFLIKMCIKENSGGIFVCVIGIVGFILYFGFFGLFFSVCDWRGRGSCYEAVSY